MDKKESNSDREDSVYTNLDTDDDIMAATERLFKPKRAPIFRFFAKHFSCFFRPSPEDALPIADDSFAEPMPPNPRP
jgi:hypothetical protein